MTVSPSPPDVQVVDVTPELLAQWLAEGSATLIDVRESFEHVAERVAGDTHHPLSRFDANRLHAELGADPRRVVFYCRTGRRSFDAATRFAATAARGTAYHLANGIEGWKAKGHSVIRSASAPRLDVMRQVQIAAGSLVLTGVVLGTLVSPWFLGLSGFVGAGLIFAGVTGWCGMAKLLGCMPWNVCVPKREA
ncbi:MAG: rhodanese-like domain-containing protein [Planctomycetota bacterium]